MKRWSVAGWLGMILVSAVSAGAVNVPWWTEANGNPYTDPNGNQWAVYQVNGTVASWGSWLPMTWDASGWAGPAAVWGHPTYTSAGGLSGGGACAGLMRIPALTFQPNTQTPYSWYGSLSFIDGTSSSATVIFGKFDAQNNWTQLYSTSGASGTSLTLDNIPALQGIRLATNEKLGVLTTDFYYYSYNLASVSGAGLRRAEIPWWTGTDGNPYTDSSGNTWRLYQTSSAEKNNPAMYSPMVWNAGSSCWFGPAEVYGHPSYRDSATRFLTSGGNCDVGTSDRLGVLAFTPGATGCYSWAGRIFHLDGGGGGLPCTVEFGKVGSTNNYSLIKSMVVNHLAYVDLSSVPELQHIYVQSNEKLVVWAIPEYYGTGNIYFIPDASSEPTPACIIPHKADTVRNVKCYGAKGDGVTDDTDAIQAAIGNGVGIIYFPSGTYVVSHEIKVWGQFGGTSLVGDYSGNRPTLLLKANTPGYQDTATPAYVVRFYQFGPDNVVPARYDTYGSQLDGINITMESGNPGAIGVFHDGAQNSSVRNCTVTMTGNLRGIDWLPGDSLDENISIVGGRVGFFMGPGQWPINLKGCTFSGQTEAAIDVNQCDLVLEGCVFDGCAAGIRVSSYADSAPRLYLESCLFKNISGGKAILGINGTRHDWLMAMKNVYFQNVTNIAYWTDGSSPAIAGQASGWCRADYVTHGNRWSEGVQVNSDGQNYREVTQSVSAPTFTAVDFVDAIPGKAACVNVKSFGAVGNGIADDTQAIRNAIANATQPIWFPMGTYKVHDTITLNSNTKLIGEQCKFTEIRLVPAAGDTSFNNPSNPKPLIDTVSDASGTAVFAHFAFNFYKDDPATTGTVEFNGLISIRWRVGRNSIVDDIWCFNWGGTEPNTGYAPLKVTGGGGGHIRQFTAPWNNTSGPGSLIIDGTTEPLTIYGFGAEHNLYKPEVLVTGAKNVTFRSLQGESNQCLIDAYHCNNLVLNKVFYNIATSGGSSFPFAMHFTDCSNVEVYTYWWQQGVQAPRYAASLRWLQNGLETIVPETGIAAYRRLALFHDGFESNNFTAGGWTNSGCDIQTTYKFAGAYAARFNSSDRLTKSLSTANYHNIQVQYARYTRQCETNDYFIAEWYNGSSWTTLENLAGNSSWTVKTFTLPSGANNNSNFQLRFRTSHNGIADYAYVDEVKIIGVSNP